MRRKPLSFDFDEWRKRHKEARLDEKGDPTDPEVSREYVDYLRNLKKAKAELDA